MGKVTHKRAFQELYMDRRGLIEAFPMCDLYRDTNVNTGFFSLRLLKRDLELGAFEN